MIWDQESKHPVLRAVALTPLAGQRSKMGESQLTESVTLGSTQLDSEVTWKLSFHHPDTLTDEETRQEFEAVVDTFIRTQTSALTRCLFILGRLPRPVVTTVIDQLQEIAQYETCMWQFKADHGDKPSIGKNMKMLSVVDE